MHAHKRSTVQLKSKKIYPQDQLPVQHKGKKINKPQRPMFSKDSRGAIQDYLTANAIPDFDNLMEEILGDNLYFMCGKKENIFGNDTKHKLKDGSRGTLRDDDYRYDNTTSKECNEKMNKII